MVEGQSKGICLEEGANDSEWVVVCGSYVVRRNFSLPTQL